MLKINHQSTKSYVLIISLTLSLVLISQSSIYSQPNECTDQFESFCGCYPNTLCLVHINNNGDFQLGGTLSNGFEIEVINANGDGAVLPNNFITNNQNNWNNWPLPERIAIDALRIIEIGTDVFNNLGVGDLIVNNTQIQIDALPRPEFGNGPYAQSGVTTPDQMFLPDFNINETIVADVLAHEIGHFYVNENHSQLDNAISLESSGIEEFLSDMIGLFIESQVVGAPIDWEIGNRDYSVEPTSYSSPAFQNLDLHSMANTGGHWAWTFDQENCMPFDEFFIFMLNCLHQDNAPLVIDYNTFRSVSLRHFYLNEMEECTDCYVNMVNAWNSVGVGPEYSPQTPNIVFSNTGPCSFIVEWEDQGVQSFNYQLVRLDNGGNVIEVLEDDCVRFETSFNICTSDLIPGDYNFIVVPACGLNCIPIPGVVPLEVPFSVPGNPIPTNVQEYSVVATNCDLVMTTTDIGLENTDYIFSYMNNEISPTTVYRIDGEIIFYFDDQFQNWQNGFQLGDVLELMINDICNGINIIPIGDILILNDEPNLIELEIIDNLPRTSCNIQPVTTYDEEFTRFEFFRARIANISEEVFNRLNAPNADRSFENPINRFFLNTDITFGFGPQIPVSDWTLNYQ